MASSSCISSWCKCVESQVGIYIALVTGSAAFWNQEDGTKFVYLKLVQVRRLDPDHQASVTRSVTFRNQEDGIKSMYSKPAQLSQIIDQNLHGNGHMICHLLKTRRMA